MPDIDLAQQAVSTALGVGGGGTVVWWLMRRVAEQYDAKHKAHEDELRAMRERIATIESTTREAFALAERRIAAESTAMQVKVATVETSIKYVQATAESVGAVRESNARLKADVDNIGAMLRALQAASRKLAEKLEARKDRGDD